MNDERSGLVPGRFVLRVALLALALTCSGCDRLGAWLAVGLGEPAARSSSLPAALGAYDCAPGLVRCVEGRVERSSGGSVDAITLERKGCPFELVDTCAGRCVDDEDPLEDDLPELCIGDADFRLRHPHVEPVQAASMWAPGDAGPSAALGSPDAEGASGAASATGE